MESSSNPNFRSLELLHLSRKKYIRNSISDLIEPEKNPVEPENKLHLSSCSAEEFNTNRRFRSKAYFDVEEIKKNIQDTENRRLEREREIDEICNFNDSDERETPYIKAVVETTTTIPSPRRNEERKEGTIEHWLCCCKKYCVII